jgi:RNA polymerase sigma factor (sigma-70 family)
VISDSDLATRVVLNGDTDALGELYQRHAPAIHDFLLRTTRDPALAEDLTQMTFLKAFERRAGLRDPSRVRSWLFSIASHTALDEQRQRHPADDIDQRLDLANPAPGPEDQLTSKEAAALVWSAAASLEPRQYAVLDLTVRQQLTTPEVAAVLGIDPGHAAVLVNRAKEALGNAVRYLLVARRRTHCPTLSAMVPAGVRELTPEQRTSVDHHMRHCAECRTMASALTRPVEILGGIATIGLPRALQPVPGTSLPPTLHAQLTATHLTTSTQVASAHGVGHAATRGAIRNAVTSKVLAAVVGVAVIAGAGTVSLIYARGATPSHTTGSVGGSPNNGGALTGPSTWHETHVETAIEDAGDTDVILYGVSCPTPNLCAAVDSLGNVVTSTDPAGGPSAWKVVHLGGGNDVVLGHVSCPSASLCVAVGSRDGDSVVVTSTDPTGGVSSWQVTNLGGAASAVSCPTASFCVAVGPGTVLTSTHPTGGASAWRAAHTDGQEEWDVLSCPTATLCVAMDQLGDMEVSAHPTGGAAAWMITNLDLGVGGVSCATGGLCVAVGTRGDIATSTNPTGGRTAWKVTNLGSSEPLSYVSCPNSSFCVAWDANAGNGTFGHGQVLTSTDPTGGASAWAVTNFDGVVGYFVDALSCPSPTLCVAVGQDGVVISGP